MVMCLAAALDMHASPRHEPPLRTTLTTTLETDANAVIPDAKLETYGAPNHRRTDRGARKPHKDHTSPRASRVASAASRFRTYTRDEVKDLIRVHAAAYGIDASLPLAIAHCESGFKWNASNSQSSARGVFQYLSGTWRTTPEGRKGTSVFNTEAHIRMAVAHIATLGTAAWKASRSCWTKVPPTEFDSESHSEPETETLPSSAPEPASMPVGESVNSTES
jgi:hypothetical protein